MANQLRETYVYRTDPQGTDEYIGRFHAVIGDSGTLEILDADDVLYHAYAPGQWREVQSELSEE